MGFFSSHEVKPSELLIIHSDNAANSSLFSIKYGDTDECEYPVHQRDSFKPEIIIYPFSKKKEAYS